MKNLEKVLDRVRISDKVRKRTTKKVIQAFKNCKSMKNVKTIIKAFEHLCK
jgi:hypothetical protein